MIIYLFIYYLFQSISPEFIFYIIYFKFLIPFKLLFAIYKQVFPYG